MPRVCLVKTKYKENEFQSELRVDKKGTFSIKLPPESQDDGGEKYVSADNAAAAKKLWEKAIKDFVDRTSTQRKVLCVKFDSVLREGGKKSAFTDRCTMLILECMIGIEVCVSKGGEKTYTIQPHPDYAGFNGKENPFPSNMRLSASAVNFYRSDVTIIDWSQEAEDLMVRACNGVMAVVDLMDGITSDPSALEQAAKASGESGLNLLGLSQIGHKDSGGRLEIGSAEVAGKG